MLITVRDLLQQKGDSVWSISPDKPIIEAVKTMATKQIGDLLVLEDGQIAGIVSERDIVWKIAETDACKLDEPVSTYMTRNVFTVDPTTKIEECMQIMTEEHVRHLPVVENDRPVGMISIGDVIKALLTAQEFTIDQMEKYISGGGYNQ